MPHSPFAIRYSLFAILDQGEAALRRGFTLIETALAMLAVGLGLLAFLGLGRLGLQSDKESLNDRRCAMLSNAVFETLREYNARFTEEARTNTVPWGELWLRVLTNDPKIPFPSVADITTSATLVLQFQQLAPAYVPTELRLSDWNPRYQLRWSDEPPSPVAQAVNAIHFTLIIYPDGDTFSSEARVYTTTLTNSGGLP
jgi:Tfp pilus assembly protein PilV